MVDTTDNWYRVGTANPFRYRGYYYDNESGLYYLQSRYYDPVTGRFLNADDTYFLGISGTVIGFNLFSYCENEVVSRVDFNGYYWHQKYKGFKLRKDGFDVDENLNFLSRPFCLLYAYDFLICNGRWRILRGYTYSGMNKTRIAQELWFHALAYYLGSYMKTILSFFGQSSVWLNDKVSSARVINVNEKDERAYIYSLIWYSGNTVVRICHGLPIPWRIKIAII